MHARTHAQCVAVNPDAAPNSLQVLPPLGDVPPEARLNLVIHYLRHSELSEAFNLIKDLEPTTPQECVHAAHT